MWWRFLLIAFYLLLLLVLSRILDTVVYYQNGFIANKLLDPVSFGVQKLKTILDQRGLNYIGIVDKSDLTELVKGSGSLTEGEIETSAILSDAEEEEELTFFTCADHFLEKVEDSKDSAWLIQVINKDQLPVTMHRRWKYFERKISKFGIKNGVVNCTFDSSLCQKKGWISSQLILALPEGKKPKDQVVLKSLPKQTNPNQVAKWVEAQLSARFHEISSIYDFKQNWFDESVDLNLNCLQHIEHKIDVFPKNPEFNEFKFNQHECNFKNVSQKCNRFYDMKNNCNKNINISNNCCFTSNHKQLFDNTVSDIISCIELKYGSDTENAFNFKLENNCSNQTPISKNNISNLYKMLSTHLADKLYLDSYSESYKFFNVGKNKQNSYYKNLCIKQYPKKKKVPTATLR